MVYHLVVYVPADHAGTLKEALFDAGAGRYAQYDRCSWETLGSGQFRPLEGANPAIGKHGVIETVPELKIEMVCTADVIKEVLYALKKSHPYEEPAYGVFEMKTIGDFS